MSLEIKITEYYNTTIGDHAGEASKLLSVFAGVGISLLAFKAVPIEPGRTRFSLFPNDSVKMTEGAKKAGVVLEGPYSALWIQGDDESGALADIYDALSRVDIKVDESYGIADIKGGYGVVLFLRREDCERAVVALEK